MGRGVLFIVAVLITLMLLINGYVYQGVEAAIGREVNWLPAAYWTSFGVLNVLMLAVFARRRSDKVSRFAQAVFHVFFVLFVTQLVFLAVLLAEDVYRVAFALFQGSGLPPRAAWVSIGGLLLAGIPFVSLIYGITHGKHDYRVHRHVLHFEDLPPTFDGFTITQLSDIHAGSFTNSKAVERGIELVNAQASDLFVFTGDLVNNVASEIEPWIPLFSRIKAPYGKFAVLGNHDYGDYISWPSERHKKHNLETLASHHEALGHKLLLNQHVGIRKGEDEITLIGVENWGRGFTQKGRLEQAIASADPGAFKVLLSHDPSHWDFQVKGFPVHIHLTLSGHTHGMQFGIETRWLKWSPVKYRYPHWAGLTQWKGRYLHVNRGFGFLGFSGRVGIWPEITVLELRRGIAPADRN